MKPLEIRATLSGPVAMPHHPIALDALLAYAVFLRDGVPPATLPSELQPIAVDALQLEPEGRFHLASVGFYEVEQAERKHIHKRAPIEQYRMLGRRINRVMITAGANKSYRIPFELLHLVDDSITWWCVGDQEKIEALLSLVHYLGKKRSCGLGKVRQWSVSAVEPWKGFPLLRDGEPLRNLPEGYRGATGGDTAWANVTYPYWDRTREEPCVVPQ